MKSLKILITAFILFLSTIAISQETVAILPFTFTENGHLSEQQGKEAQQYLIGYITKKQKHFKATPLNARNVNVALHKAGITTANFDDFTIQELSNVVHADYILLGSIDKSLEGANTTSGGFDSEHRNGSTTNTYGGSSTSSSNKYSATVYISIFKSDGTSLFDSNKGNVFIDETADSWKNSIIWLSRHFPLYK
jgi:hypothetical protein